MYGPFKIIYININNGVYQTDKDFKDLYKILLNTNLNFWLVNKKHIRKDTPRKDRSHLY